MALIGVISVWQEEKVRSDIIQATGRTPETLVEMAVRNAGLGHENRAPRWHHVSLSLGVGSTVAKALCALYGFDADEDRGGCETCYRQIYGEGS